MDALWVTLFISILFFSLINLQRLFFSLTNILLIAGIILFLFIMNLLHGFDFSIPFIVFMFTIEYCLFAAILFQKSILPVINERLLHITALCYIYNVVILSGGNFRIFLMAIAVIPVCAILYYSMVKKEISRRNRILLYCCYLAMLITIQSLNLYSLVSNRPVTGWLGVSDFLNVIFLGGLFFYICIYGINLHLILPGRDKHESKYDMEKRIAEQSELFLSKFSDLQASPLGTLVITGLLIMVIAANHIFQLLHPRMLSQVILIMALIMGSLENILIYLLQRNKTMT